ncbi:MAG: MFS transporter [Coriobacteriales bacterium]|nr:MFS transporter [Actinomycetes bacterium]
MAASPLFAPLGSRDYRRLWSAQFISVVGDKVNQIAMSILVYKATGSILQVGVMLAITTLPAVLFGMAAGVFVDRWDRRTTMVVSDLLRGTIVLSVPLLIHLGLPFFYLAAFGVSTVSLFFEPARLSLIPDVVEREHLMAANSLDNVTTSVSELLGLAFGAGVVSALGASNAFVLDAITYLVSAALVATVSKRTRPAKSGPGSERFMDQLQQGLRYINEEPVLRDLVTVYTFASAGVAASITAVNGLGLERFGSGAVEGRAVGLAVLDAAITIGLLLGSASVGRSGPDRAGRKFLTSLGVFGAVFASVSLARTLPATLPLLMIGGVANMWFFVPGATIIQRASKPDCLGRVFAAKNALSRVATVLGFLVAGVLAEYVGLPTAVALIGMTITLVSVFGWTRGALRET